MQKRINMFSIQWNGNLNPNFRGIYMLLPLFLMAAICGCKGNPEPIKATKIELKTDTAKVKKDTVAATPKKVEKTAVAPMQLEAPLVIEQAPEVDLPVGMVVTENATVGGQDMDGMSAPLGNQYEVVTPEVPPAYPGGMVAFSAYVKDNFQYPVRCQEEGISGEVLLRFKVDIRGKISDITVLKQTLSCPEFTSEAIRVLRSCNVWVPGKTNGKNVTSFTIVPIKLMVE